MALSPMTFDDRQKYRGWLVTFGLALLASCAPPPPSPMVVGSKTVNGEVVPFASNRELLIAGLANEGLWLADRGRFLDAEARFRQGLYLDPRNYKLRQSLAVVLDQQALGDEALALYEALIAEHPTDFSVQYGYARALVTSRQYARAVEQYRSLYSSSVKAARGAEATAIARELSKLFVQLGDDARALCYSFEALSLSPGADEMLWHAATLLEIGLTGSAVDYLEAAVKSDRSLGARPRYAFFYGLGLFGIGKEAEARTWLERAADAVKKDPELSTPAIGALYLVDKKVVEGEELEEPDEVTEKENRAIAEGVWNSVNLRGERTFIRWWPRNLVDRMYSKFGSASAS